MPIEILIDGETKTVTKEELFGLAAQGIINPLTPLNYNGKLVTVGKVKGITFGLQQNTERQTQPSSPPPTASPPTVTPPASPTPKNGADVVDYYAHLMRTGGGKEAVLCTCLGVNPACGNCHGQGAYYAGQGTPTPPRTAPPPTISTPPSPMKKSGADIIEYYTHLLKTGGGKKVKLCTCLGNDPSCVYCGGQGAYYVGQGVIPSGFAPPEQLIEDCLLQDIIEGNPVNFKKVIQTVAEASGNTSANLDKLITAEEMGYIYLKALNEAVEYRIHEEIRLAIFDKNDDFDAMVEKLEDAVDGIEDEEEYRVAFDVLDKKRRAAEEERKRYGKARDEMLTKNLHALRKRLQIMHDLLEAGARFCGSPSYLQIHQEWTSNGQRAGYDMIDVSTGARNINNLQGKLLKTEPGYLDR